MLKTADALSRLGTETAFSVMARAQALAASGRDIINLGIGQPDFPTPPHIVEAAIKALRDGHHGYTQAMGIPSLREAVADYLGRQYGVSIPASRVMIVPGGKVTMWFAVLCFGQPGAEVIYPDPGFPIYRSVIDYTGATAVPLPLREEHGFGVKAEDVIARLSPATRLIILNSPGNPSGGVADKGELDALAKALADRPDIAILSDEIYSRMLYHGRQHVSLLSYPAIADRVILLDGWSKTYAMTGWRLGFAVWPEALLEPVERLSVNSHSCVNAAAQYAGLAALTGPQDAVAEMVSAFDTRRLAMVDGLNKLPGVHCVEPMGAFYAFPNITGTGMESATLQRRLLEEAGVATIAGPSFGDMGEGYLRLSFASGLDQIEDALFRMESFLGGNLPNS
jgi:aspartate/methionine/tyrosine aminotransferase